MSRRTIPASVVVQCDRCESASSRVAGGVAPGWIRMFMELDYRCPDSVDLCPDCAELFCRALECMGGDMVRKLGLAEDDASGCDPVGE